MEPGTRFGRLMTVGNRTWEKHAVVWCICECGNFSLPHISTLIVGKSKSCGCLRKELLLKKFTKHKMSKTKEHNTWVRIRQRCENPKNSDYYLYGGRGISVCERWQSFENFYADMGDAPSENHSIDRIDGTKNYEPSNCRWATVAEQSQNRNCVLKVTHNSQTKTLKEWELVTGIKAETIYARIFNYYWPVGRALNYSEVK